MAGLSSAAISLGQLLQVECAGIAPLAEDPQKVQAILDFGKPK